MLTQIEEISHRHVKETKKEIQIKLPELKIQYLR